MLCFIMQPEGMPQALESRLRAMSALGGYV